MSIKADIIPGVPLGEEKNEFSRSGTDTACINCQCGYNNILDTDDTLIQRGLKKRIQRDTSSVELQKICDDLGIIVECDGAQEPSLSGKMDYVCFHTRQKIIDLVKRYKISFQVSHADDLADIG